MHVHLRGGAPVDEATLLLLVANGVTTVRDMHSGQRAGRHNLVNAADQERIFALRRRVAAGELLGPRIYTAGDPDVTSPTAAAQSVAELKTDGHDFVKVTEEFTGSRYDSVAAAARRLGMRIVGHAPFAPLDSLLASGQWGSLEHFYPYYGALLPWSPYGITNNPLVQANILGQALDTALVRVLPQVIDTASWMRPDYRLDAMRLRELAKATRRAKVWNCPTSWAFYDEMSDWPDSAARVLMRPGLGTGAFLASQWGVESDLPPLPRAMRAALRATHRLQGFNYELIKALQDAGAGLLLGTDMMTPGDKGSLPAGFNVIGELREMTKAGLTPYQALATATRNVAEFFGTQGWWRSVTERIWCCWRTIH